MINLARNLIQCYLIVHVVIICSLSISAQSFKYRNYNFKWLEDKPKPIPVDDQFKDEDAVILQEENVIGLSGGAFKKHVRIKFLTQKGIDKYARFVLPEGFDPVGDLYGVRISRRDTLFRPKGEFECVRYFASRIIKPDGKVIAAEVNESIQKEVFTVNQIDRQFFNWIFSIQNVKIGDEVEAEYAYEVVYNILPSEKIFFNGILPKQNYKLSIKYSSRDIYIFNYNNGAEPNDSVMVAKSAPHNSEFIFKRTNLKGGINETGARPYSELPFITYYLHHNDYGEVDPKTDLVKIPHPYPWSLIYVGEVGYAWDDLKLYLSKTDRSTVALNHFFEEQRNAVPDTNPASLFSHMHHLICADFDYQNDNSFFATGDQGIEKLAKFLEEKKLRYISRYNLYDQLLYRLNSECYKAPMLDKRIEAMNISRYEPMSTTRIFYSLPVNGDKIYFYPKADRFGYETNEFPFYYEDINIMLIPQLVPTSKRPAFGHVPFVNFIFTRTPFSDLVNNQRSSNVLAAVLLDSLKINFDARVKLSGQFSTLTRGYYLYGSVDTTINLKYFQRTCDIGKNVKIESVKVSSTSQKFPFDSEVRMKYSSTSGVKQNDDTTFSIDLSNWFNHVIDTDFSAATRNFTYYPDFQFQDIHKYFLKFDRSIELEDAAKLKKEIENGFGKYTINISQPDDKSIMLETVYIVKARSVPAANAADVAAIFDEIKKLDSFAMKIKAK